MTNKNNFKYKLGLVCTVAIAIHGITHAMNTKYGPLYSFATKITGDVWERKDYCISKSKMGEGIGEGIEVVRGHQTGTYYSKPYNEIFLLVPNEKDEILIIKEGLLSDKYKTIWSDFAKLNQLGDTVHFKRNSKIISTYNIISQGTIDQLNQEIFPRSYAWGLGLGMLSCVAMALKANTNIYAGLSMGSGACLALLGLWKLTECHAIKKKCYPLHFTAHPSLDNTPEINRQWRSLQYLYGVNPKQKNTTWYYVHDGCSFGYSAQENNDE